MELEYERWSMINFIVYRNTNVIQNNKQKQELHNILERLLMTISNFNKGQLDIFPDVIDDKYLDVTRSEMEAKGFKPFFIENVITDIQLNFDRFSRIKNSLIKPHLYEFEKGTLRYGHFEFEIPVARMEKLRKLGGDEAVIKMLLRYGSILEGSQHWHVPIEVYKKIDLKYKMDVEAFASPINSQMILMRDKPVFCSLFKDTDAPFGSQGSFFDYDFTGKCSNANTPFVPDLLKAIKQKLYQIMEESDKKNKNTLMFIVLPGWYDANYVNDIIISKWSRKVAKFPPGSGCYFRGRTDEVIPAYFHVAWVVMASGSYASADFSFMDKIYEGGKKK